MPFVFEGKQGIVIIASTGYKGVGEGGIYIGTGGIELTNHGADWQIFRK